VICHVISAWFSCDSSCTPRALRPASSTTPGQASLGQSREKWPSSPHFQHLPASRVNTSITPLMGTFPPGSFDVRNVFIAARVVIFWSADPHSTATIHAGPASSSICRTRAHDGASMRITWCMSAAVSTAMCIVSRTSEQLPSNHEPKHPAKQKQHSSNNTPWL
jgi:hypothetical protein